MRCITLIVALAFALGCSGHLNEAGNGESADASTMMGNGASAEASAMTGDVGTTTTNEAGPSSSSDAIAPVPCEPTVIEAGAASMTDAEVPVNHRPTHACCPAQRGPGPPGQPYPYCTGTPGTLCPSDMATTCSSDSQCTAGTNGRCFPWEGLVGPGGCSYDECFTDSTCGPKTPCLCRSSSTDNSANVCNVTGNCAVDSDCGPGAYCSPSVQIVPNQNPNVCWGSQPYYCHTASDLCINDSDCAPPDAGSPLPGRPTSTCAYNPQDSRWECVMAVCALP